MYKINKRYMLISFAIASFVLIELLLSRGFAFSNVDKFIIKPKYGQFFVDLVNNPRRQEIEKQGWSFWNMTITGGEARYIFKHKTSNAEVVIFLSHPSKCNKPVGKGEKSFCLSFEQYPHPHRHHHSNATVLFEFIAYGIENNINPFKWTKLSSKKSSTQKEKLLPFLLNVKILSMKSVNKLLTFLSNKALIQFVLIFPLFLFLIVSGTITVINQLRESTTISIQMILLIIVTAGAFLLRLNATRFLSDIRDATDMGFVIGTSHRWVAGYSVYLHLLFWLFPRTHETVYIANIFIGTLTIPILYNFVKIYLQDDVTAGLASAAILAFLPIHAKFSASDSPHILLTFSYFSSLWFLSAWRYQNKLWFLIQGMGWLMLMFNIRIDSMVYSVSALLIIIGCLSNFTPRLLMQFLGIGLLFSVFAIKPLLDILVEISDVGSSINLFGFLINPFFYSEHTPIPFQLMAVYGILIAVIIPLFIIVIYKRKNIITYKKIPHFALLESNWLWNWRRWICLLATTFPIALPSIFVFATHWRGIPDSVVHNTNYRYFLPLLATYSIFAGYGLKNALHILQKKLGGHIYMVIIIILALVCAAPWWGFLKRTWTHQLEFEFIRNNIKLLSNNCEIVRRQDSIADAGLEPSPYISVEAGRNYKWISTADFLASGTLEGCVIYYKSATCFARDAITANQISLNKFDELPECKEMREKFTLIPIVETFLPALPYVREEYTRKPVPVGFYIVKTKMPKTGSK